MAKRSFNYRILPGLPGTGPEPIEFNPRGEQTCREGFVVEFRSGEADEWVGNFGGGLASYSDVCAHPDGKSLVVIARGCAYRVLPETRQMVECFGCTIVEHLAVAESGLLLLVTPDAIICHDALGFRWETDRISWDGLRGFRIEGDTLYGEAWDPSERWAPFTVDLRDGSHTGGTYAASRTGPLARFAAKIAGKTREATRHPPLRSRPTTAERRPNAPCRSPLHPDNPECHCSVSSADRARILSRTPLCGNPLPHVREMIATTDADEKRSPSRRVSPRLTYPTL